MNRLSSIDGMHKAATTLCMVHSVSAMQADGKIRGLSRYPGVTPKLHLYFGQQAALLDSLYGTERGLAARSEVRAEINELISQLEAKNPTPNPTEVR